MRKSVFPIAVLSVLCTLALTSAVGYAQNNQARFVKDEILIKFRNDVSKKAMAKVFTRFGAVRKEDVGRRGWVRVKIRKGQDPRTASAEILSDTDVEAAQPNFYYKLAATPNDPQWTASGLYGLTKISAPAAWDVTTGSQSVVVANIDTGMRYTHEDLAANVWTNPGEIQGNGVDDDGNGFADDFYGYDFFYNDPDPIDEHGHGTHTGGTIGAVGNNSLGVVGVNWSVKIMVIKIFNVTGDGTTSAMIANAYDYVRMMKERGVNIRVTNNSYTGEGEDCRDDIITEEALNDLGDAGILNVFAAGNNALNNDTAAIPNCPASYEHPAIFAVASSNSLDNRSSFSAYGANSVDIAAPGSVVLSTTNGANNTYGTLSGTSMAAPHVTGAAALLAAFNPALSAASLKSTLMNNVDTFASLGGTIEQNWASTPVRAAGRLNAANALLNQTVCKFDLSENNVRVRARGGYFTIGMTAPRYCDYAIKSNERWILAENAAASGNGELRFKVRLYSRISRTGTITIAGQTVTVTQSRIGG